MESSEIDKLISENLQQNHFNEDELEDQNVMVVGYPLSILNDSQKYEDSKYFAY